MSFGMMGFGMGNIPKNTYRRNTYSAENNWGGTTGMSRTKSTAAAEQKLKKLQYDFKLISSQIMRSKTSGIARQAASRAKRQTVLLRRKRATGEYDEVEIQAAIIHSQAIERVAKKKVKHLLEEERLKRTEQPCEAEMEEKMEECAGEDFEESTEEISEELSQEMKELMREYEELMRQAMEDIGDNGLSDDLMEELTGGGGVDMDPADLKALRQKHRCKELQEIAKADAKYLRAMFQKYESERQQVSSGVSLNLGGMEMPAGVVDMRSAAAVVEAGAVAAEGGSVDVSV